MIFKYSYIYIFRILFFIIISYGLLYFSYKHYTPIGAGDYVFYKQMMFKPFDYNSSESPFVYRQISPVISFIIYNIGIFYDTNISYSNELIEKKIFFSNLISNFIALNITAFIATKILDLEMQKITVIPSLLVGLICFVSFGTQVTVLTMLVEGWTWAFITFGFYAMKKNNLFLFVFIIFLSIFQKEIVSITLGILSFLLLFINLIKKHNNKQNKILFSMFITSLLIFIIYIIKRIYILPVNGYENQINLYSHMINLVTYDYANIKWLISNFLMQNVFIILCFILIILILYNSKNQEKINLNNFIVLFLTFFGLYFISIGSGLKGDIAHILFVMTPLFSIYLVYYLYLFENITNNSKIK